MDRSIPEIRFNPSVDPTLVMVSIEALANAFFAGIDKCVVDAFADLSEPPAVEARLQKLLTQYPNPK